MQKDRARARQRLVKLLWRPQSAWWRWTVDVLLVVLAALDALLNFPAPRDWHFVVSVIAAAVLLVRRKLPRTVLLATLPGVYAGSALIAAMVAVLTVAVTSRPVWQKATASALVVAGYFVPWPLSQFAHASASDLVQRLIYAVMLGTGPLVLGLLIRTQQDLSDRVAELAVLRDQERALHEQSVLSRERARIAREMHDVVSHQAGLIAVQAGALQVTARDPAVQEVAATLRKLAVATLEELRSMILVLRAAGAGPTELVPQPTLGDLPRLVAAAEVDVALQITGADGRMLPEPAERTAYRTVQEALTNVRKHAPGAATTVRVTVEEASLRATIHNGPASASAGRLDLPGGKHGIIGLRERAALLGGSLVAEPTPDGGFTVALCLPLARQEA